MLTHIHDYSSIQSIFTTLTFLCVLFVHPSFSLNPWKLLTFLLSPQFFSLSGSYSYYRILKFASFRLASFNMHLRVFHVFHGLPCCLSTKESACQFRRCTFSPSVGKIPWRKKWQPTSVFLPGKSHGQRNLAGYSPWSHKKQDMTQGLNNNMSFHGLTTCFCCCDCTTVYPFTY